MEDNGLQPLKHAVLCLVDAHVNMSSLVSSEILRGCIERLNLELIA